MNRSDSLWSGWVQNIEKNRIPPCTSLFTMPRLARIDLLKNGFVAVTEKISLLCRNYNKLIISLVFQALYFSIDCFVVLFVCCCLIEEMLILQLAPFKFDTFRHFLLFFSLKCDDALTVSV